MLINFTSAKNVLNILPYFFVYLNIIIANISNAYCPKEFRFILFSCPNIFSNLSWLLLLFHLLHQNNYKCYIIPCLPTGQSNIKSVQQTSVWIHPRICSFYAVPFFIQYIVKQIAFFPTSCSMIECHICKHTHSSTHVPELFCIESRISIEK